MGNICCLCGSKAADTKSTTSSSSNISSPSSSAPGISRTNNYGNTTFWAKSRTSGYSQLSGAMKTPKTKSSSQLSRVVRIGDLDGICVKRGSEQCLPSPNLKKYSFADLKAATNKFGSDMILGSGGFGTVFKGWVNGKTLTPSKSLCRMCVAIKKLNSDGFQGFKEWQSEVNFLGRLSHPNVINLMGYCWEDEQLLLVYEFLPKGSLENHLFRRRATILSWDLRLKIAIGAARGLAFLHTSEMEIIYRDFKASNILLDGNYNAKIADFGLAKLGPLEGNSHVTTQVMGTYGYVAPEYIATGYLYVKSDVYGFGVVLLELLTGLRAIDVKRPNGQQNLVDWKKPMLSQKKKLKSLMDAGMEGQYSTKAALQAAQLALRCLENEPGKRPSMREVVEILEEIEGMEGKKPKESKLKSSN
ncbi:PREDICTED: probable serine/threonine-protein kinase Cx32, chloroplastic [Ipomoea nil]|uniref:probable serine/threonine-protein kinase Cx32, chloroplastic n=1 Tax=Ipomoea nil TaxID=35883 RepID=UPI000901E2E3|nr:PREDICTED: probable serine/threonine-protein kinase Cx32, chloroplastic [Ipomoea nil]